MKQKILRNPTVWEALFFTMLWAVISFSAMWLIAQKDASFFHNSYSALAFLYIWMAVLALDHGFLSNSHYTGRLVALSESAGITLGVCIVLWPQLLTVTEMVITVVCLYCTSGLTGVFRINRLKKKGYLEVEATDPTKPK